MFLSMINIRFITSFTFLALFLLTFSIQSQTFFEKKYGTTGDERGLGIVELGDGGYIVAGHLSTGFDVFDLFAFRMNALGEVIWAKKYGGFSDDGCRGIVKTLDGNFVLMGYNGSSSFGGYDVLAIKIDGNGNQIWSSTVGGFNGEEGFAITASNDGGVVITGYSQAFDTKDVYIVKLNANGGLDWTKIVGATFQQWGSAIIQTLDGGYLITGASDTGMPWDPDFNAILLKLDPLGNTLWMKHYGGLFTEEGRGITELEDSSIVIVGKSNSFGSSDEVMVARFTKDGNFIWSRLIGGTSTDIAHTIAKTNTEHLIIGGYTTSYQYSSQAFIMKMDYSGNLIWHKNYGQGREEIGYKTINLNDTAYGLAGVSSSHPTRFDNNILIIITDTAGNSSCPHQTIAPVTRTAELTVQSHQYYSGSGGLLNTNLQPTSNINLESFIYCDIIPVELKSLNHSIDGNNVIINWSTASETNNSGFEIYRQGELLKFIEGHGTTTQENDYSYIDELKKSGVYSYEIIQLDYDGTKQSLGTFEVDIEQPQVFSLEQNFPNPFNPVTIINFTVPFDTQIKLKIFDSLGKEVQTLVNSSIKAGYHSVEFDGSNLSSGVYYYILQAENFTSSKKLILLK